VLGFPAVGYPQAHSEGAAQEPDTNLAECERLAGLTRRQEAIDACKRAGPSSARPAAARSMVRALMSGPAAPTVEELAYAFSLADDLLKKYPDKPWGHAAMFDIAVRIGDDVMLQRSTNELERVAPQDPETMRARERVTSLRHGRRVWLGWLSIAFATIATFAHALWQSIRRGPASGRVAGVSLVCLAIGLALLLPTRLARAAPSDDHPNRVSNWPIDDSDPEMSIPSERQRNQDPVEFAYWLQDLAFKATTASKKGNHPAAIRYFTAMVKAVPDRAIGYSRLCEEYAAVGDRQKALGYCDTALHTEGVKLNDFIRYVEIELSTPGDLNVLERATLSQVMDYMRGMPDARQVVPELECQVALKTDDMPLLERCTTALIATRAAAPVTALYEWSLALKRGNYQDARWHIRHAQRLGMNPEGIARMERETDAEAARQTRKIGLWILAGLLTVLATAAGIVLLLRRRDEPSDPVGPAPEPVAASGS
jgi:hypothetical protein